MSRRPQLWFFFLFFAATLSCGLWRYSGVMFFLFSAISWPRHATLERIVCKHSCAGAGEPRRRAESWRSAAASSARWIGSRRSPKLRSSAVARAIGLLFCLADALRGLWPPRRTPPNKSHLTLQQPSKSGRRRMGAAKQQLPQGPGHARRAEPRESHESPYPGINPRDVHSYSERAAKTNAESRTHRRNSRP